MSNGCILSCLQPNADGVPISTKNTRKTASGFHSEVPKGLWRLLSQSNPRLSSGRFCAQHTGLLPDYSLIAMGA